MKLQQAQHDRLAMVHEYIEDLVILCDSLKAGHAFVSTTVGYVDANASAKAQLVAFMRGDEPGRAVKVDYLRDVRQLRLRHQPRAAFRRLLALGLTDAFRARNASAGQYTFWDYQAGAWQRDHGFRIDHLLLSPALADRLIDAGVDKDHRGREKASDHAPTWVELRDIGI